MNKKNKHNPNPVYHNVNPFKLEEKKYKLYHHQQTNFSEVLLIKQWQVIDGYQVGTIEWPKGVYLVKSFNNPSIVVRVGLEALNNFVQAPYRTNLDSIGELYQPKKQQLKQQQQQHKQQPPQQPEQHIKQYYFNQKIRWSNVGYQYDWSKRMYPSTKTEMHPVIVELSDRANKLYNSIRNSNIAYNPQSAIINYYSIKDYMTGHLDDAEIDQSSPIYSFSFGLSCIFLIGGTTKDEKPVAIRLDSGDLLIMAGEARHSYHGVPRVLSNTYKPSNQLQIDTNGKNGVKQVNNYYNSHRININIRQVYPSIQL